jgi:hypothetical protein
VFTKYGQTLIDWPSYHLLLEKSELGGHLRAEEWSRHTACTQICQNWWGSSSHILLSASDNVIPTVTQNTICVILPPVTSQTPVSSLSHLYNPFSRSRPSWHSTLPFTLPSSVTPIFSSLWTVFKSLSWTQVTWIPGSIPQLLPHLCLLMVAWGTQPVQTDLTFPCLSSWFLPQQLSLWSPHLLTQKPTSHTLSGPVIYLNLPPVHWLFSTVTLLAAVTHVEWCGAFGSNLSLAITSPGLLRAIKNKSKHLSDHVTAPFPSV